MTTVYLLSAEYENNDLSAPMGLYESKEEAEKALDEYLKHPTYLSNPVHKGHTMFNDGWFTITGYEVGGPVTLRPLVTQMLHMYVPEAWPDDDDFNCVYTVHSELRGMKTLVELDFRFRGMARINIMGPELDMEFDVPLGHYEGLAKQFDRDSSPEIVVCGDQVMKVLWHVDFVELFVSDFTSGAHFSLSIPASKKIARILEKEAMRSFCKDCAHFTEVKPWSGECSVEKDRVFPDSWACDRFEKREEKE